VGVELSPNGVEITFTTVAGRLYQIEFTEVLDTPWQALPNGLIRGDGPQAQVRDATATSLNRFYRVTLLE
jgi:hypothetical protein